MKKKQNEFVAHLLDLLEPLGDVKANSMFGGFGIYRQGLMFAVVSKDTLYLKADDKNRPEYEAKGLGPFTYKRKGKEFSMSYYKAPPGTLEDSEELCQWARKAHDAAVRAVRNKPEKKAL